MIAVRVANEGPKDALLELDEPILFTEPHDDGDPAVLVRLAAIDLDLLGEVLTAGWRRRAPKRLVSAFDDAATAAVDAAVKPTPRP